MAIQKQKEKKKAKSKWKQRTAPRPSSCGKPSKPKKGQGKNNR